jgi:hypothetical protein
VLTSIKDDTVGGDINNDGGVSLLQRGDWGGVCVFGGNATITNAVFRYGASSVI